MIPTTSAAALVDETVSVEERNKLEQLFRCHGTPMLLDIGAGETAAQPCRLPTLLRIQQ